MQFRIRIGTVPITGSTRAEHHDTTVNGAFVHFFQMNGGKMNFQCTFVAERFEANIALDTLLSRRRINVHDAKINGHKTTEFFR